LFIRQYQGLVINKNNSAAIKDGGLAFIHREYLTLGIVVFVVAIIQKYMPCSVHLRICRKFIGQI